MNHLWTVFKREFLAYFTTPMAYVLMFIYVLLSLGLTMYFGGFIERGDASLNGFFSFHPWIYMIFGPAIGMRLWSEEHRQGTTELLLTMPISPWQAILGKYLAAVSVLAITLLATIGIVFQLYSLGDPDGLTIWSGYLGSFFVGATSIAITMAVSAFTRNQITCLLVSTTVCFVLVLLGMGPIVEAANNFFGEGVSTFLSRASLLTHQMEAARGSIHVQALVYFISVIGFCLFLTSAIIRSKRS